MSTRRQMDEGAQRWLIKTARKNYWRVACWYDLDDLIQDGHLHYARILIKYPHVTDRPHLMRLFQRAFYNHLHDLSKDRTREVAALEMLDHAERISTDVSVFLAKIAVAPGQLRALLLALTQDENCRRLGTTYRFRRDLTRETFNERLCRIAGVPPDTDLQQQLLNLMEAA